MQAIQCKHPSETDYRIVRLTDTVKVKGKHYAIAVDIYDSRNKKILNSFLNVISRNDKVSLVTFGHNAEEIEFDMSLNGQTLFVTDLLKRKETGLNTLVGVRCLEKIKADEYIMITAGLHDSASWNLTSKIPIKLFSPGDEKHASANYCRGQAFIRDWDILYFPKDGPNERLIRSVLDIKHSQYYDIRICGGDVPVRCQALPYGGYRKVCLPYTTQDALIIQYIEHDGTIRSTACKLLDDESIHYLSDFMKPCAMVE